MRMIMGSVEKKCLTNIVIVGNFHHLTLSVIDESCDVSLVHCGDSLESIRNGNRREL